MKLRAHFDGLRTRGGTVSWVAALLLLAGALAGLAQRPSDPREKRAGRQAVTASDAYVAGERALGRNDLEGAMAQFARAAALDPGDAEYPRALAMARERQVTSLVGLAAEARAHGQTAQAEALLARARTLDPQNGMIAQHAVAGATARAAGVEVEPWLAEGPALAEAIAAEPNGATRTFHLRGDAQTVTRAVMEAFGLRTVFDGAPGRQTIRFDLEDTTYAQATPILFSMAHLFAVPLDAKTLLLARDTAENRQRLERQVQETIYIPGQTVEQLNDLANVIRNIFDVKQLTVQQAHGTLVLRAPGEAVKAINLTLADLLDGGAEVVIEMKLYSVDLSTNHDAGFQPPQFGAYNVSAAAAALVAANQGLINQGIAQGLISATDSVVAQAFKLIASGLVTSTLLSSTIGIVGGTVDPTTGAVSNQYTTTGITSNSTLSLNLALNSSETRALEDVQARVADRQTANFRAGMRYPITTSTYSTPSTSSALSGISVNGQSASSLLAQFLGTNRATTIPQVSYEDLGLTLKATPTVQKSGLVSMHLDLKLEALGATALNGIPVLNSRTLTSDVTVREGETALLVSTVSSSEVSAVTGFPGVAEIAGLRVPTEQSGSRASSELVLLITPRVVRHRANTLAGPRIAVSVPPSGREE